MTTRLILIGLIMFMAVLMTAFVCRAVDVTFSWDANTESDLAGYRLFQRTGLGGYDYNAPVWEGVSTETTLSVIEVPGETYCFVLRAFDQASQESGNSNEVCWTAPVPDLPPADPKNLIIESIEKLNEALLLLKQ